MPDQSPRARETRAQSNPNDLNRLRVVLAKVGRSKAAVYSDIRAGTFPRPFRIGKRSVGWRAGDVDQWLTTRPQCEYTPAP
jgi:predicted DNA-binding transcriptional regulator AlpA